MEISDKIKDHVRMYGWKNTFIMGFKKVISFFLGVSWYRFVLFEQKISVYDDYGFDFRQYDIRTLSLSDFENREWLHFFLNAEKRAVYIQRFASPIDECHGIFVNGELACLGWNHYGELLVYNQFHIESGEQSVYMYDDFCLPKFRGHGFHKIISAFRKHIAASKGATNAYIAVSTYNRPSLKNQYKGGFKIIRSFVVVELWGHTLCTLKKLK